MDIKRIGYFIETVNCASIAKAARKLKIDQSVLNRAIKSLEDDLNAELYVHFGKTFRLTAKGDMAYRYFKRMISTYQDLNKYINIDPKNQTIDIYVTTTNGTVNYYLMGSISRFYDTYPQICLSFMTNDLIQNLEGNVDVSIGPKIEGDDIENFYLYSYNLKMFASEDYLERMGRPSRPEDLDKHHLIAYSREDISTFMDFDWHLRFGSVNGVPRKPYFQVSSSVALQKAAQNGLGIITFSEETVKVFNLGLVDIFPDDSGLKVDIYFSHKIGAQNEWAIKLYRSFLVEYFQDINFRYRQML